MVNIWKMKELIPMNFLYMISMYNDTGLMNYAKGNG